MTATLPETGAPPLLVRDEAALAAVAARAAKAELLALDVEGNGLFAYRARLCTLQLAWEEEGRIAVAIVDTLTVALGPLGEVLGESGPCKVLHDLTFDARLLSESGVMLGRARDTSVAARMLGRKATGLASLLASEVGLVVPKQLQQHDWSRRPLEPEHIAYLATDVLHLATLDEKLGAEARALDIEEEIAVECSYKLATAFAPPRDTRPPYLRVKGAEAIGPVGLAILRRLLEERERVAERLDVPPFKVAGAELLLEIAQRRPTTARQITSFRGGGAPRVVAMAERLVEAVRVGVEEGCVPEEDLPARPRFDRAVVAAKRARESRLTAWRRTEAAARGVDEQVVLPGHCLQELASDPVETVEALSRLPGLGQRRTERYGAALLAALRGEPAEGTPEPEPE